MSFCFVRKRIPRLWDKMLYGVNSIVLPGGRPAVQSINFYNVADGKA